MSENDPYADRKKNVESTANDRNTSKPEMPDQNGPEDENLGTTTIQDSNPGSRKTQDQEEDTEANTKM